MWRVTANREMVIKYMQLLSYRSYLALPRLHVIVIDLIELAANRSGTPIFPLSRTFSVQLAVAGISSIGACRWGIHRKPGSYL